MYCPKCGAQNIETNKYCRACREDLQPVSQAMQRRLPVILASKLDAALDRKNERFRRDSILSLAFGAGLLLSSLIQLLKGQAFWKGPEFLLFLAATALLVSLWEYLAYKRSLSLGPQLEILASHGEFTDHQILTLGLDNAEPTGDTVTQTGKESPLQRHMPPAAPANIAERTTQLFEADPNQTQEVERATQDSIHCPKCGHDNPPRNKYCRACGENLQLVQDALKKSRFQALLRERLDRYIKAKSDDSMIRHGAPMITWMGVIWVLLGLYELFDRSGPLRWLNFLLGIVFLFTGLWDYLGARRRLSADEKVTTDGSFTKLALSSDKAPEALPSVPTTDELTIPSSSPAASPSSVTEGTTQRFPASAKMAGKNSGKL